jgi:uncharacterized membrane protein
MRRGNRPESLPSRVKEKLTQEALAEHYETHLKFRRTQTDRFSDFLATQFGTTWFLFLNALIFSLWLTWNTGMLGLPIFDPFPHNFLTTTVSLEAIFLSIIVLMSQNRQGTRADIRQKMDFEIDVRAEEEITKILIMLEAMHKHFGISCGSDAELEAMKRKIDFEVLRRQAAEEK